MERCVIMRVKWIIKYLILTVILFPLLMMIGWSISSVWSWPSLTPQGFTLRAYSYILDPTTRVFKILVDSVILSIVVTALTLLVSIPAARAIAFYDFKGKSVVKVLILLPLIVPMLTVAMGIHLM